MGKIPNTRFLITLAFISWLVISCSALPTLGENATNNPKITNYHAPQLSIDAAPFDQAGCPKNEYGHRLCQADSPLLAIGCWKLQAVNPLMGGLQPGYAMIECVLDPDTTPWAEPGSPYIYNEGCSRPIFIRYAIYDSSNYRALAALPDLQAAFAPIESENEALSYAIAATGYQAMYGLQVEKGMRYLVDSLSDTHVEKVEEGYRVFLFSNKLCGCGPHPIASVVFLVTPTGELHQLSFNNVFEDPQQDDLCVD